MVLFSSQHGWGGEAEEGRGEQVSALVSAPGTANKENKCMVCSVLLVKDQVGIAL